MASAVMGNPINAVAWLANKLHEYGVTPEAGHVILSGSFIKAIPFEPGDTVVALFDRLGEVTFGAVRSPPEHRGPSTMRFGVTFSHPDLGNDPGFLKEFAQTVEGAGFDHLLAAEHVIGGHPDRAAGREGPHLRRRRTTSRSCCSASSARSPGGWSWSPHPDPAAAPDGAGGQAGRRARPAHRRPAAPRRGRRAATGWSTRRSTRTSRTAARAIEEQVEVLRRLWTEELVTFDGRWHHLDRMGLNPMPVQRPIPIWMGSFVGAVVEKVMRRIARLADGWFPQMPPGDELAAALDRLRGYAVEAGRDPATLGHRVRHRGPARRRPAALGRPGAGLPRARGHPPPRSITAGGGFTTPCRSTSPPPCAGSTALADPA